MLAAIRAHDVGTYIEELQAVMQAPSSLAEPMVRRIIAGGEWIRTFSSALNKQPFWTLCSRRGRAPVRPDGWHRSICPPRQRDRFAAQTFGDPSPACPSRSGSRVWAHAGYMPRYAHLS